MFSLLPNAYRHVSYQVCYKTLLGASLVAQQYRTRLRCRRRRRRGAIPGWGRSSGGAHGNPLQYSCLENPMDRRACTASDSVLQTRLKQLVTNTSISESKTKTFLKEIILQLLSGHIYVIEYRKSTEKIINRVQQDETDYPQET